MPSIVYWLLAAIWAYLVATFVALHYVEAHYVDVAYSKGPFGVELLKKLYRIAPWGMLYSHLPYSWVWLVRAVDWVLRLLVIAGPVAVIIFVPVTRIFPILLVLAVSVLLVPVYVRDFFREFYRGPNPDVPDYAVTLAERRAHSDREWNSCLSVPVAGLVAVFCVLALVLGWYKSWPVALAAAGLVGVAVYLPMRAD
jgi:hypothetical protein